MGRKIGEILIVLGMIFLLNVLGSRAEEKVQMYQIYCEEPNGEKGYYTKSVKVEIEHLDQECITKFQLNFPDGKELTGKLEKAKEKIGLTTKIFIALIAGAILGIILFNLPAGSVRDDIVIDGILYVIGQGFIKLMKMLVVPLVFCSLVCGSMAIGDTKNLVQ